jgi:hypothetical protein
MNNLPITTLAGERKFDVMKRDIGGRVHKIGQVMCVNKVQADTRVTMMYRRTLQAGETVWAVDPMKES